MAHVAGRMIVVLALALSFAVSTSSPAAAKGNPHTGGGGTNGSISLVLLNSTDGLAHWGQSVTFTVSTTATAYPYVDLSCYQNGTLVAHGMQGFFPTALGNQWFVLQSTAWQGGDADCTATIEQYTRKGWAPLASTSFHVYP
jgi:hypothetical protein